MRSSMAERESSSIYYTSTSSGWCIKITLESFLYHLFANREALASTATGVRESLWLGRAMYCTIDGAELDMLYYMDFSTS